MYPTIFLTTNCTLHIFVLILLTTHYGLLVFWYDAAHCSLCFLGLLQCCSLLIVYSSGLLQSCSPPIKGYYSGCYNVAHFSLYVVLVCYNVTHCSLCVAHVFLVLAIILLTAHYACFMFCCNIAHCPGAVAHHLWLVVAISCLLFLNMYHPGLL